MLNLIRVLPALVFVLLMSCQKQQDVAVSPEAPAKTAAEVKTMYVIKQGNHYCEQSRIEMLDSPEIRARVLFDSSAIYSSIDPVNQADVNKLVGFSDCGTEHQQNSARLGWSWTGRQLMIYAYAYVNSTRITKTLGPVPINAYFPCSVKAGKNYYYFGAGQYLDSIPRHCTGYSARGYKLFPYFGGDEVAPHEVHVSIVEENAPPL